MFTGYFEPIYPASQTRTGRFHAPVYGRPRDLVELDLGRFRESLAGQRLAGLVEDGRLIPYASHGEINREGLGDRAPVLAWMDPNDLFFLQIQGSGILAFSESEIARIGYAGQNGHPYRAIGRDLVEQGALELSAVSLQSIRTWLEEAPQEAAKAMRENNASYVFFEWLRDLPEPGLGPLGAQGVQLTPLLSLAADRRFHAMGTPTWIDIEDQNQNFALRHMMIIQDTGGAIRGPVRGDVFWGRGEAATARAGGMNARGILTVLIPKQAAEKFILANPGHFDGRG